jgi:cysteine desulfurase
MAMYVDHAATTPLRAEVLDAMLPYLRTEWGNPSSLHAPGRRAASGLQKARGTVAEIMSCAPEELVFTGSGSEGANIAIKGAAMALATQGRRHIVTSRIEHHGVLETCRWLATHLGFTLTEIEVNAEGLIDLDQLERSVTNQTAIVSVGYANNEVGTIQPIEEVARIGHQRGALVHTDAVQAAGALDLDTDRLQVDFLSMAAHKFYGPKGVGALYIRRGSKLVPQTQGGGQERGRRSGTENVAGVVGLAEALDLAQAERSATNERLWQITDRLLSEVPAHVPGTTVTGHRTRRLPSHASFAFDDVEIASILLGLDRRDIWASSGSACTSRSSEPSHVLVAMGVPRRALFGALRVTFGQTNARADVDTLLEAIPPLVAAARQRSAVEVLSV